MTEETSRKPTCLFLGIGCAILVALGAAAIGGVTYWGWQKSKQLRDPEVRADSVREILGVDELPEGYKPVIGMEVPWVMKFAILSDREVTFGDDDDDLGDRAFIYFQLLRGKNDDPELRDFFEGRSDDPRVLRKKGVKIDVDLDEVIGRGVVEIPGGEALFVSAEGGLETDHGRSEGITTISLIQCPQDKRLRVAIWEGPLPEGSAGAGPEAAAQALPEDAAAAPSEAAPGADSISYAGTPADPETLRAFLSQFSFCR